MIYDDSLVDYSKIKNNFEKYNHKYYNMVNLKLTYMSKMTNNCNSISFFNLKYYYLCINKQLKELSIPFLFMCYYKEKIVLKNNSFYQYSIKHNSEVEYLYIYFLYQLVSQIFKIFDNTYVCLNKGLNLGVNQKYKINEKYITQKLSNGKFKNDKVLIEFKQKNCTYNKSLLFNIKERYRNKYIHDFVEDIPKEYLEDDAVEYKFFDYDTSFNDILKLLEELENHLISVDKIISLYISDNNTY